MKWLRRLLWAVGALLLLWGVAWLAVPPLVKWQAEQRLSELTGRQVTVGAVAFSPWALRLSLADLAVAPAPGTTATEVTKSAANPAANQRAWPATRSTKRGAHINNSGGNTTAKTISKTTPPVKNAPTELAMSHDAAGAAESVRGSLLKNAKSIAAFSSGAPTAFATSRLIAR